jgi:serine/threonine protein kinase
VAKEETSNINDSPADHLQASLPSGSILDGRFEILSFIGQGGMSVVYKARQVGMERLVAVKMLLKRLMINEDSILRFQREAVAASALDHPNIVQIYGFGVWEEQPYMAIEYLDGKNLADLVESEHRLQNERAVPIFSQILEALAHAHSKGIIHRDLKLSNVVITKPGDTVKLVDFGIAKILPQSGKELQRLTQTGEVFGSPVYMSPEQCMGGEIDARSDIYAMGCLMYEVLTGQPPFSGDTAIELMTRHVGQAPDPVPLAGNNIAPIVLGCLQKDPELRPQSAQELKEVLLNPSAFQPSAKRANMPLFNSAAIGKKKPNHLLVAVLALTCLVAAGSLLLVVLKTSSEHQTGSSSNQQNSNSEPRQAGSELSDVPETMRTNPRYLMQQGRNQLEHAKTPKDLIKYSKAAALFETALELQNDPKKRSSSLTADEAIETKLRLADAFNQLNEPDKSKPLLAEIIAARKAIYDKGRYDWFYSQALGDSEEACRLKGDAKGAVKAAEAWLRVEVQTDPDRRTIVSVLQTAGEDYAAIADWPNAKRAYERELADGTNLGVPSSVLLIAKYRLAYVYLNNGTKGDHDKGVKLLKEMAEADPADSADSGEAQADCANARMKLKEMGLLDQKQP